MIVVTCKLEQKASRYATRAGLTREAAAAEVIRRSAAQLSDLEKCSRADFVIDNSQSLAETERQVEGHLDTHLERLPAGDTRSRAILRVMRAEEIAHGARAAAAGGAPLPAPVRALMRHTARVMTSTAYWV